MKATIKANNPTASVKANPNIAYLNNFSSTPGFLDNPKIKLPKTIPTPTPAPVNPIVANPAPQDFPNCKILFTYSTLKLKSITFLKTKKVISTLFSSITIRKQLIKFRNLYWYPHRKPTTY